jgi:hypothetical protein
VRANALRARRRRQRMRRPQVDLRVLDNCVKATKGCEWVFQVRRAHSAAVAAGWPCPTCGSAQMAADMGGMGFIESNQSVLTYNNTMINFNMMEVRSAAASAPTPARATPRPARHYGPTWAVPKAFAHVTRARRLPAAVA